MPLKIGSDRGHPFFKPLWRRIAVCVASGLWAVFEITFEHDQMWMILSGGLFVYAVYVFLITWPKEGEAGAAPASGQGDDTGGTDPGAKDAVSETDAEKAAPDAEK